MKKITYLTPTSSHWACDIEADNLKKWVTQIWCVVVVNLVTKVQFEFTRKEDFLAWREAEPDAIFVGHNFLSYDAPVLNRLWGADIKVSHIVDTFILSQMYSPTFVGGHSLESWGKRLRYPKGDFSDFSAFTPEMLKYCRRDTYLVGLLFIKLSERMRAVGFSERGVELEHKAWHIIQNKQKENGFPFDYPRAQAFYVSLRQREEELKDEIYKLWPPVLQHVATYKQCRKKDGEYTKGYLAHRGQFPKVEERSDGGYDAFDYVSFNLGSPPQRIAKLLELGWQPTNLTKKGNPKVDEDELLAFAESSDTPEVKALAKWIVINSRANMVRTWLDNYDEQTGCIHGSLFIASTLRYRHSGPNSANIPAVRLKKDAEGVEHVMYGEEGAYAYESRDLWTSGPDPDWVLIGVDGTGIQNRCLVHGLIKTVGPELVEPFKALSLSGDIHRHNIEVLELANKAAAKKFYYCVPMDTKALTKGGWKGYEEIGEGELVLTYNPEKKVKEWKPVLEKVYFEDAPVIEMGHTSFKVRSTPNHRWFTHHRLSKNPEVVTTEQMTTMQNIIVNAEMEDTVPTSLDEHQKLSKYGNNWTASVLTMSQQERKAFLAGFMIADGYQDSNANWRWSQLRGPLFEAALLASYLVHDGYLNVSTRKQDNGKEIGTVTLNQKGHVCAAHFKYNQLENQPVWCVRTENESWVIRQDDVITITGNTLMMGGGGARLAADQVQFGTVMSAREGDRKKKMLVDSIPGFKDLIAALTEELEEKGRITLCDETPLLVPSPHMVIPYLLQGDESRLMKQALIFLDEALRRGKNDKWAFKVADIHDEWQWRVHKDFSEEFVQTALPCFLQAGESFNYLIPIEGDAKIGCTWAETH